MKELRIRALVVDDFEPFRRVITEILQTKLNVLVVGEASDGWQAVRQARILQPDLIVLDIGLPKLNGIEAARRIRDMAPQSKILFVSQESSRDFVDEAFRLGAWGYIHKSALRRELFDALTALLQGERFIGSMFTRNDVIQTSGIGTSTNARRPVATGRCHEVALYPDDSFFLDGFVQFIHTALDVGNPVIVIATESHRDSILEKLRSNDSDVESAIKEGRYVSLDAAETLSKFMVNELPDRTKFFTVVDDLILKAARTSKANRPRVAACGECAPLLLAQGLAQAAIQLEKLWDEVAKTNAVSIFCGYQLDCFRSLEGGQTFQKICAQHSSLVS